MLTNLELSCLAGTAICIGVLVTYRRTVVQRLARLEREIETYKARESRLRGVMASHFAPLPTDPNTRPAFQEGDYQLCGGCGASVTLEEISQCLGEACPRFKKPLATPIS